MKRQPLNDKFKVKSYKGETPFLNVKITHEYDKWDGVLAGTCSVHGQEFFFVDIVESVWRNYADDDDDYDADRLWRVYAVYDIDLSEMNKIFERKDGNRRITWRQHLASNSNVIGIFWR